MVYDCKGIILVDVMIALKIILTLVGLAFIGFGYFIYFEKKYSLINGFEEAYKRGEKNENYAKCIGLIEFILGIIIISIAVILFIFV